MIIKIFYMPSPSVIWPTMMALTLKILDNVRHFQPDVASVGCLHRMFPISRRELRRDVSLKLVFSFHNFFSSRFRFDKSRFISVSISEPQLSACNIPILAVRLNEGLHYSLHFQTIYHEWLVKRFFISAINEWFCLYLDALQRQISIHIADDLCRITIMSLTSHWINFFHCYAPSTRMEWICIKTCSESRPQSGRYFRGVMRSRRNGCARCKNFIRWCHNGFCAVSDLT